MDMFLSYKKLLVEETFEYLIEEFVTNLQEEDSIKDGRVKKVLLYRDPTSFRSPMTYEQYFQYLSGLYSTKLLGDIENEYEKITAQDEQHKYIKDIRSKIERYIKRIKATHHLKKHICFCNDLEKLQKTFLEIYSDTINIANQEWVNDSVSSNALKWTGDTMVLCTIFNGFRGKYEATETCHYLNASNEELSQFILRNFVDPEGNPFDLKTIKRQVRKNSPAKRNMPDEYYNDVKG